MDDSPERAGTRLKGWLKLFGDDPAVLKSALTAAARTGYIGPRFHNLIIDESRRQPGQAQASLPFRPTPVGRTNSA
jgi:hypothetical protein